MTTGKRTTKTERARRSHLGESWPYHMGPKGMTPCSKNPCRYHSDSSGNPTDVIASSPEEATRLHYERTGETAVMGLSSVATAQTVASPEGFEELVASRRGRTDVVTSAPAAVQLERVGEDPGIPDDVKMDYARWLDHAALGHYDLRGRDGFERAPEDMVAMRPSLFVVDDPDADPSRHGMDLLDDADMVTPTRRPFMDSSLPPERDRYLAMAGRAPRLPREDSSFLLHDFGRGQARSLRALRILTGPAPSAGLRAGAGTDGASIGDDGSIRWAHDDADVPPVAAIGERWMDSASPSDRPVLVEAARHPWGGAALADAFLAGQGRHEREDDGAAADRLRGNATADTADHVAADRVRELTRMAAETDGMADMLAPDAYEGDPRALRGMFSAMRPSPRGVRMRMTPELLAHADRGYSDRAAQSVSVRVDAAANTLGYTRDQIFDALDESVRNGDGVATRFVNVPPRDMVGVIRDSAFRVNGEPPF